MKTTLHLLMGLPGSGKTTLAKLIQKQTKSVRLSSDEYRLLIFPEPSFSQKEHDSLYGIIDHNVEHLLAAGHDVIYDANLNRRKHREEKYALAKKHGAKVILWWVKTPLKLAKYRRLTEQDSTLLPAGETPENLFNRIVSVLEEPDPDEKHIEVDGTKITESYVKNLLENKV
jgi:predicted kinase